MIRRIALIILAGCIAAPTHAFCGEPVQVTLTDGTGRNFIYNESHALLIANGKYTDVFWGDIETVYDEANELESTLRQQGFEIFKDGVQKDLTGDQIDRLVKDFIDKHGVGYEESYNNRLIIFFSGHGRTLRKRGYIIPVDAPAPTHEKEFCAKAISMDQVVTWAKLIDAKHVLFIFDSCFSGTVFGTRSGGAVPAGIQARLGAPVREFLTAGGRDEVVPPKSVFTPYLIRGLSGEADSSQHNGFITASSLAEWLKDRVAEASPNKVQFGPLPDPDFDKGDMVFLLPQSAVNPPTKPTPQAERTAAAAKEHIFSEDAPDSLVKTLQNAKASLEKIYSISVWDLNAGAGDLSFVASTSKQTYWQRVPETMQNKMAAWDEDSEIAADYRAFLGQDGDWLLIGKGGRYSVKTNSTLRSEIETRAKNGTVFNYASFTENGYCVICDGNGWISDGAPDSFLSELQNINKQGTVIKTISLGPNQSWCIVTGRNGWITEGVSEALNTALQQIHDDNREIEVVELLPGGGWIAVAGD